MRQTRQSGCSKSISRDGSLLRHPRLDKPYFWEFHEVKNAIAPLFRKELSYDWFFAADGQLLLRNLDLKLSASADRRAQGRPLFQCCRTFGRAAALRETLAGMHIHLWRNPWDQWWSYQVDDYFERNDQLIFNAAELPPVLRAVKAICGIADFHDDDIDKELAHDRNHRLAAREDYVSFYALWLYSMLACERTADLSINIDALTASAAYRQRIGRAGSHRNRRPGFLRLQYCAGTIRRSRPRHFSPKPKMRSTGSSWTTVSDPTSWRRRSSCARGTPRHAEPSLPTRQPRPPGCAMSRPGKWDALAKTQRDLIDATRIARRGGSARGVQQRGRQAKRTTRGSPKCAGCAASTRQRLGAGSFRSIRQVDGPVG